MIKVEVIEKFNLKDFDKIKNVQRKSMDVKGTLYAGDTFECDEKMVDYLTGNNPLNKVVVKVIEVDPEKKIEEKKETIEQVNTENVKPKSSKNKKASKK